MVRGFAAHRVGVVGIAGQQVGLATAAAKVLVLFVTGATGLGHPVVPPVMIEARAVVPDLPQAQVLHVGKANRQQTGTVTG